MRKLALTVAVLALIAAVGASPAFADDVTDPLVFTDPVAKDELTPEASAILRDPIQEVPHHLRVNIWTTADMSVNGTTVPAGTQLSKVQFASLTTAQLANTTETMPANAIVSAEQKEVTRTIDKARRAGRVLPALGRFGTVGLEIAIGVAAGTTFTKALKMELPGQGSIYRLITGESYTAGTIPYTPGWKYRPDPWTSTIYTTAPHSRWYLYLDSPGNAPSQYGEPVGIPDWTTMAAAMTGTAYANTAAGSGGCSGIGTCWVKGRTDAQMDAAIDTKPTDADTYNNTTNKYSYEYTTPTLTDSDDDAMAEAIADDQEAIDSIAEQIEPGSAPIEPGEEQIANPTPVIIPPTTVPTGDGFNFAPISDIDFGCKFPYGLFCYAVAVTTPFDVSPDAPVFDLGDICVSIPAAGEQCAGPYVVDLNVMDDYMAIWRTILSVVLWVGAVYLIASRVLGWNAGGDPGAAMDDVL